MAGPSELPYAGIHRGRDEVAKFFQTFGQAAEFEVFEPQEYFAKGDRVVVLGHERQCIKATGQRVETEWAMVFVVGDGRITKFHNYVDTHAVPLPIAVLDGISPGKPLVPGRVIRTVVSRVTIVETVTTSVIPSPEYLLMYSVYRLEPRQPMGPARTLDQVLLLAEARRSRSLRNLRGWRCAECISVSWPNTRTGRSLLDPRQAGSLSAVLSGTVTRA